MLLVSVLFVFLFALQLAVGDLDEQSARLLLFKSTLTEPVVEGQDFKVSYQVVNTGDATATSIEIADRYDPNSFETKENVQEDGTVSFEMEELPPGAQAAFNVTVRPLLYGIYESTRARIKYGSSAVEIEGVEADFRNGYSTSLGRIKIISKAEYERSSSYHVREWSVFILLYSLPTLLSFILWLSAKSTSALISTKRKSA